MTSPNDLQDVKHHIKHIKPRKIKPLIKDGEIDFATNIENIKPALSANEEMFDLTQNTPVEEEIQAEFSKHIEELKLRKARLLIGLTKRVSALSNEQDSETSLKEEIEQRAARKARLQEDIKQSVALIRECDVSIAMVKNRALERKELFLIVATEEQNPDSNLVRFVPPKILSNAFSKNRRHTFFGAPRQLEKPENLPTPINGPKPPTFPN